MKTTFKNKGVSLLLTYKVITLHCTSFQPLATEISEENRARWAANRDQVNWRWGKLILNQLCHSYGENSLKGIPPAAPKTWAESHNTISKKGGKQHLSRFFLCSFLRTNWAIWRSLVIEGIVCSKTELTLKDTQNSSNLSERRLLPSALV